MKKHLLVLAVALTSGSAGAQIVKCIENGKTSFSDSPCPRGAVSIPMDRESYEPSASLPLTAGTTLADRAKAETRERHLREIDFDLSDKERKIKNNIDVMSQEIAKLQKESASADENKANAIWQRSLAIEMRAISMKYQMENDALQKQIDALRKERSALLQSAIGNKPSAAAPSTTAPTLAARAKAETRERRLREIEFDIDDKERKIKHNIETMSQEITRLRKEAASASENKLNALWQQSLAEEMGAVSMKYETENNALQNQIDALRKERRALLRGADSSTAH